MSCVTDHDVNIRNTITRSHPPGEKISAKSVDVNELWLKLTLRCYYSIAIHAGRINRDVKARSKVGES